MHLKFQSVRFTSIQSMFTLAFLLAASVIAGCSSGPPEHGTAFVLEVDTQKLVSPLDRGGLNSFGGLFVIRSDRRE